MNASTETNFLGSVRSMFNRAAYALGVPPDLVEAIRERNSVIQLRFPVRLRGSYRPPAAGAPCTANIGCP